MLTNILEMEKEIISKQGDTMPKVLAIDENGKYMAFFCDISDEMNSRPDFKQLYFRQVGAKIRRIMEDQDKKLQELVFIASAFVSRLDLKKEYTGKEKVVADKLKNQTMAPSEVPEEFKSEFVRDGLVIVTNDIHSAVSIRMMPYSRVKDDIVFDEMQDTSPKGEGDEVEDRILSAVWWGYIHPEIEMDEFRAINAQELKDKHDKNS